MKDVRCRIQHMYDLELSTDW